MSNTQDSDRNDVLNAIGAKWSKFSKQELSALTTNDEHVDALLAGRNLTA
jgi:hypothetical protein